jgi:group I intron endonuclease
MIYRATNTHTFKNYIGQTSKSLDCRRMQHEKNAREGRQSRFYSALRKYGSGAFVWSVFVSQSGSRKETDDYERFLIRLFQTQDIRYGYNMAAGGEGMSNPTDETRRRMSESHKGKVAPNKGRKFTGMVREKMIARLQGCTGNLGHPHSVAAKAKMRLSHLGKNTGKRSASVRAKMSQQAQAREKRRFIKTVAWG